MNEKPELRLSNNIEPTNYDITLEPDLTNASFTGNASINLKVNKQTNKINFHANDLDVKNIELQLKNKKITPKDITFQKDLEEITLIFDELINPGTIKLSLYISGKLNDQLRGFYRSTYTKENGEKEFLATTQFEATDARRAFPCWDEPNFKATFKIKLIVSSEYEALSNMALEKKADLGNGKISFTFKQSPVMSTYLLAFIVGKMSCIQAKAPSGTLVRIWATTGKESQGKFALENAINILEVMNNYFGINYPLEKLDHIAIPDFAAGAMENWGAITYRETLLLFDPQKSSSVTKQRILEVMSHETAHMWFGDLVTMHWWDDLWLNESFATWMGDKVVSELYPEWDIWTQFFSHDTNTALALDGLRNSHPIEAHVNSGAEIRELFDAISYSKGGSVLRMLEQLIGINKFKNGIQEYIKKHEYDNASTKDLWTALEKYSSLPITKIVSTWTQQTGYPLVTFEEIKKNQTPGLEIRQKRFTYDNLLKKSTDNEIWQIPISIKTSNNSNTINFMLSEKKEFKELNSLEKQTWLKMNYNQTGFYRVRYSQKQINSIKSAIKNHDIPAIDRLGIQNDSYALCKAGFVKANLSLDLLKSYRNEINAIVWEDIASNLISFERLIWDQDYLNEFDKFCMNIYSEISKKINWEKEKDENHLKTLLRNTILTQLGHHGDKKTIETANILFKQFLSKENSINPDLHAIIFRLIAQDSNEENYETLWELYQKESLHEQKLRLLLGMSQFNSKKLITLTLERSLGNLIRSQDTPLVLMSIGASSKIGRDLTWAFIKENWEELDRRYGDGGFSIVRIISLTSTFTSTDKYNEVKDFFVKNPAPSAERAIQQSLERISNNAKWLDINHSNIF